MWLLWWSRWTLKCIWTLAESIRWVSKPYSTWYKLRALVGACLMHTFTMSSRTIVLKSKIDQRARLTCVVLISYISVAFWGDSVVSAEVDFHLKKEDKLWDSDATRFDSSWRRESREVRRFSSRIQLADSKPISLINAWHFSLIILSLGCLWLHIEKIRIK